jgi:hypothetical protein
MAKFKYVPEDLMTRQLAVSDLAAVHSIYFDRPSSWSKHRHPSLNESSLESARETE